LSIAYRTRHAGLMTAYAMILAITIGKFVGVVVSLKALSSSVWLWYREGRGELAEWNVRKVIEIPAEQADPTGVVTISKALEETSTGIRVKRTKSGKPRSAELPDWALPVLREHVAMLAQERQTLGTDYQDNGLLFPQRMVRTTVLIKSVDISTTF
jgi:hypothetical protein